MSAKDELLAEDGFEGLLKRNPVSFTQTSKLS